MMDRTTGRAIDTAAHITQSVADILTTPIGSRIERRDYGSMLPDLIDHPGNPANRLRLQNAAVMAIVRWEPRISIAQTAIAIAMDGTVTMDIEGTRRGGPSSGKKLNISVPLR